MAYEQKPDTGSLFKNERKTTDQHPSMTGSCLIDGVAYFVDSWTNEVQSGEKKGQRYQSLKFKRKDKQADETPSRAQQVAAPSAQGKQRLADMDLDIPFILSLNEYDIASAKERRMTRGR